MQRCTGGLVVIICAIRRERVRQHTIAKLIRTDMSVRASLPSMQPCARLHHYGGADECEHVCDLICIILFGLAPTVWVCVCVFLCCLCSQRLPLLTRI